MAKHFNRKFVSNIIGNLKKNGFDCHTLKSNKNKYIISKGGGEEMIVHSGMCCYHPLRRWLKSTYDFNLEC